MNKTDLINKINASEISDNRKKEILSLIDLNELNDDMISEIKDIMQEDVDEDLQDILTDDQKKTLSDMEDEANTQIDTIIKDVNTDIEFVETETADLNKNLNDLTPVIDQMNIDQIKSDLDKSSV
jgi:uncharacterized protein YbjQ (UPF0145 family)